MAAEAAADHAKYLRGHLQTVMEALVMAILDDRPEEVDTYALDWLVRWQAGNAAAVQGDFTTNNVAKGAVDMRQLQVEKDNLQQTKKALLQRLAQVSDPDTGGADEPLPTSPLQPTSPPESNVGDELPQTPGHAGRQDSIVEQDRQEMEKIERIKGKERRAGVSAQSITEERIKDWKKPFFEKTEEDKAKLKECIAVSEQLQVLFGHLSAEDVASVVDAFAPKMVEAGESIIRQGEEGDFFYIVASGAFDVFVRRQGGDETKVLSDLGAGSSFGEIALMYNAPRAATVTCCKEGKVWALDRDSFQMMLVTAGNTKKKEYEGFLERVDIFKELTKFEMAQLSDMVTTELYDNGETIMEQGAEGTSLAIIEDGEAKAYIRGPEGEIEVKHYKTPGDYFGEVALLTTSTRKATVRAVGQGCSVLVVKREDFDSVLGTIKDSLARNIDKYPQYADFIQQEVDKEAAEEQEQMKIQQMQEKSRRAGVSAQTVSEERMKDWQKPFFEKTQEERENLSRIIGASEKLQVLFGHLSNDSLMSVIDAMFPKVINKGSDIIVQGEEGDNFYIVNEGQFDVLIKRSEGDPVKVLDYGPGACFGELALMYNCQRAATITATSDAKVWALDRESFQMMLVTSENTKRKEYEGFLENVDILKDLTKYELSQLSDMLEMECFDAGEDIIRQGDSGSLFYIVEDGEARAYISGDKGEIEVKVYNKPGDYFGEIALLTNAQRKASVRASGTGCSVLSVSSEDFNRVLGPIKDLLKKKVEKYPQYAQFLTEVDA